MSYFASSDEEPIYSKDMLSYSGRSKTSKKRLSKKSYYNDGDDDDDGIIDADWCEPSSEEERKTRRLFAKRQDEKSRKRSKSRERRLKATSEKSIDPQPAGPGRLLFQKLKKKAGGSSSRAAATSSRNTTTGTSRKKTRQELVTQDLAASDYHEVNDGIVGCADDLMCINRNDPMYSTTAAAEEDPYDFIQTSKVNTGKNNKAIADPDQEVYIVHQRYGYLSIFFGVIQIAVLAVMMWQCGIAPMNINPMFGPYPDALNEWGGKNSILIIEDNEWWRLLTPILLHAGVIHLFCNVAVQLELGVFFEREWGSVTWLIIYLTSALGSSVLSVITMPDAVSVGSSGAVMGLFGGKMAEIICRACERDDTAQHRVAHQVRKEQCIGVTCSVVVVLAFSFIPYVDWAAHLGGLLSGFFVGFMCFSVHMESYCLRLLWFLVGAALTLGFFIPCIDIMYSGDVALNEELRDVCGYYSDAFEDYSCNCMREEFMANFRDDDGGGDDGGERYLYESTQYYGY